MEEKSSVHRNFATNLRWLSLNRGSIADVCRALGMNRQQFNKYLSGATLPNAATLDKMSGYFELDQWAFFERPENMRRRLAEESREQRDEIAGIPFSLARGLVEILNSSKPTQLREGCYNIYYPWSADPYRIIRGLIVVFKLGPYVCFRRYVKLQGVEANSRRYPRRRHEGIIAQREGRIYFVGRNSRGLGELTLIACGLAPRRTTGLWHGVAIFLSASGEPVASRVSVERIGGMETFRSALKSTGILAPDDVTIGDEIREAVLTPTTSSLPKLQPFAEHLKLFGTLMPP